MTIPRRLAALGVTLAVIAMASPAIASAHAVRIASDPPENAVLTTGPGHVSATFNERLQAAFAAMSVVGPDGNLWSTGEPRVDGAVIGVDVRPLGPIGTYTVNYRVTSADGHPVTGSWSFRLTAAGNGSPGPPATQAPSAPESGGAGGLPVWPFVGAAAVLVVAGTWWALRRRRG